jgi:hypothetical protein
VEVFSKDRADTLALHRATDDAIYLELGFNVPYGRIYHHSEVQLKVLKAYINKNLA